MPSPVRLGQLSQKTPQRAAPARPSIPCISRGTERMPQAFLFLVDTVTSAPLPY